MGHRPYPNAERARRYVDSRHGSACPRCGHAASVHPYKHGQFECTRSRNGSPSCRECAARLMQLRANSIPALADVAAGFQAIPPSVHFTPAPGRAVMPGQISVQVQDNSVSVAEAVRRNLISIQRTGQRRV